MTKHAVLSIAIVSLAVVTGQPVQAASPYGCFQVTTSELNIRARPYSDAAVVATAVKGDILEKRKRWCTPRGFWCAIRKGGVDGYADKAFMAKVPCP